MAEAKTPFGPEELRAQSRQDYVDNECHSDQYREEQPQAGIDLFNAADHMLPEGDPRKAELQKLFMNWIKAGPRAGSYDGNEQLAPMLGLVHDILWDNGEHPYHSTLEKLLEWNKDIHG